MAVISAYTAFTLFITVVSIAYQAKEARKAKKKAAEAADARKGFEVPTERQSVSLPVVYGRALIGGAQVYHNTRSSYTAAIPGDEAVVFQSNMGSYETTTTSFVVNPNTGELVPIDITTTNPGNLSGEKNEFLYVQQALCHGPINNVIDWKLDDQNSDTPELAYGQRLHVYKNGGFADPMMTANFSERSNSLFTNTAYASMVFRLNRDEQQYGGVPSVSFYIEGKLVRPVILSGSNYSLGDYFYSNNPALCLLDYLLDNKYGRGLDVSEIDLASFYKGALVCGSTVQSSVKVEGRIWSKRNIAQRDLPLYECNLVLDTEKPIRENIITLLSSMGDSDLVWSAGRYKLQIQYPTGVGLIEVAGEIGDDDIVRSDLGIKYPSASERMNFCTIKFSDEAQDFADNTASWPPRGSALFNTLRAQDNNIPLENSFTEDAITNFYHALAKAEELVRVSRTSVVYTFTTKLSSTFYEPGDILFVNSSIANITNEYLKIVEIKVTGEGTAEITAIKFDPNQLAWNAKDDQIVPVRNNYNFTIDAPKNLILIPNTTGNAAFGIGRLQWENVDIANRYIIEYTTDSLPNKFVWLGESVDNTFEVSTLRTGIYSFHVKAMSNLGSISSKSSTGFVSLSPFPPINLIFTRGRGNVIQDGLGILSWQAVPNTFFRRFIVEYTVPSEPNKFIKLGVTSDTEFPVNLSNGLYSFYISTESFSGEVSGRSNLENINIQIPTPRNFEFEQNSFLNNSQNLAIGFLKWDPPIGYTPKRYILEYRFLSGTDQEFYRLGNSTSNFFEVVGLKQGTYVFSVRSENASGVQSARVLANPQQIIIPDVTNISFNKNIGSNKNIGIGTLSWNNPVNFNAKQFLVQIRESNTNIFRLVGLTSNNSLNITGVDSGTYDFKIVTESFTGELSIGSVLSNVVISTNAPTELVFIPEENPTNSLVNGKIRWFAPENQFVKRYIVDIKKENESDDAYEFFGFSIKTELEVKGLRAGSYVFSVIAEDVNGVLSSREVSSLVIISVDSPTNIIFDSNTEQDINGGSGTLIWTLPIFTNVSKFVVEYSTLQSPDNFILLGETSSNSFVIKTLSPGSYVFHVRTVNTNNDFSNRLSSTPQLITAASIAGISYSPAGSGVITGSLGTLSWSIPLSSSTREFIVEYKLQSEEEIDADGDFSNFRPLGVTTKPFIDLIGLSPNTYVFSIITVSANGVKSDRFVSAGISLVINKPSNILFNRNSSLIRANGDGVLSWNAPIGLLKQYLVEYKIVGESYKVLGKTNNPFLVIENLDSDKQYQFRVAAENYAGDFSEFEESIAYNFQVPSVREVLFTQNTLNIENGIGVISWKTPLNYQPRYYIISAKNITTNETFKLADVDSINNEDSQQYILQNINAGFYQFFIKSVSITNDFSLDNESLIYFVDDGSSIAPSIQISETLSEIREDIITFLNIKVGGVNNVNVALYDAQIKKQGSSNWITIGQASPDELGSFVTFDYENVIDKQIYEVRARSVAKNNNIGDWSEILSYEVIGKSAPPDNVQDFTANVVGASTLFEWTPVANVDLSHYYITYNPNLQTGAYADSITVVDKIPRPATSVSLPSKTGKYFIRAVDKSGNLSEVPDETVISTNIGYIENLNVVQNVVENPGFTGVRTANVVKDNDGYLVLNTTSLVNRIEGFYNFANTVDLSEVYTVKLLANYLLIRIDTSELFDNTSGFFDSKTGFFDGDLYPEDINIYFEVRTRNTTSDNWSRWTPFLATNITGRFFEFRVKMESTSKGVTPQIRELSVEVDMPDRIESGNDIASGTSSKIVTFSSAFKEVPSIGISAQAMTSGDYYVLNNKSRSGFTITFYNNSNNIINRTFDFMAKGYGRIG
jgi:predicted phage tail protein